MTYLSVSEACRRLRISKTTIYKMLKDGNGPPFRYIGRIRRVSEKDLDDWFRNLSG
jgi:excisionase family DNA binding protein